MSPPSDLSLTTPSSCVRCVERQLHQRRQEGGLDARATSVLGEWVRLLGNVLLPSLALLPGNPGMVHEIWEALRWLPYHVRYRLYAKWKTEVASSVPILMLAKAAAENDARKIMRYASVALARLLALW